MMEVDETDFMDTPNHLVGNRGGFKGAMWLLYIMSNRKEFGNEGGKYVVVTRCLRVAFHPHHLEVGSQNGATWSICVLYNILVPLPWFSYL